jgi:hypothetical protein
MLIQLAQTSPKTWIQVVNNVGVPVSILVFFGLVAWKLVPHVITWFKATTAQSHMVSDAVPEIKKSLASIATDAGELKAFVQRADRLEAHVETIAERTKRIEETAAKTLSAVRKGGTST